MIFRKRSLASGTLQCWGFFCSTILEYAENINAYVASLRLCLCLQVQQHTNLISRVIQLVHRSWCTFYKYFKAGCYGQGLGLSFHWVPISYWWQSSSLDFLWKKFNFSHPITFYVIRSKWGWLRDSLQRENHTLELGHKSWLHCLTGLRSLLEPCAGSYWNH